MRRLLFPIVAVFLATNPPLNAQTQCPSGAEYAVYSAVLDSLYSESVRDAYLVADSTLGSIQFGRHEIYQQTIGSMDNLPVGLSANFQDQNARSCELHSGLFHTNSPVIILGRKELERIGSETMDVSEYPDSFPARGDMAFSRVGFTPDMRYALVHVLYRCGGRCGGGAVILLKRDEDAWLIQTKKRTVVF